MLPGAQRSGNNNKRTIGSRGMAMQSGLGQRVPSAGWVGVQRRYGTIGVLLLGLSGCAGVAQIENLGEARRTTVAFESIEGPPPALVHKLTRSLNAEAGARQIAIAAPPGAEYRLRGYLAPQEGVAAVAWAIDVYGPDQRRVFRLSGIEQTGGQAWTAVDDPTLDRVARKGIEQLAAFLAAPRAPADAAAVAATPPRFSMLGWPDDWTPESAGIFRLLRGGSARPEMAADAATPLRPDEVRLPASRPAPAGPTDAIAFSAED